MAGTGSDAAAAVHPDTADRRAGDRETPQDGGPGDRESRGTLHGSRYRDGQDDDRPWGEELSGRAPLWDDADENPDERDPMFPGGRSSTLADADADTALPGRRAAEEHAEPARPGRRAAEDQADPGRRAAQDLTDPGRSAAQELTDPGRSAAQELTDPGRSAAQEHADSGRRAAEERTGAEPAQRGRQAAAVGGLAGEPDAPLRPGDVGLGQIAFWDEEAIAHFRSEWHEVKAEFVDDPVTALTRAHDLLTDAVNELTEALLAERDELDPLRTTGTPDTESMRMAMRGYREFLDRILAL